MSKIVVALACTLPLVLAGCGGGSSSAPLLTSPTNPVSNPVGSSSSSSSSSGTPTSQTITFLPTSFAIGSTLTLQGSASSGLPVTYASQTPSTCSVSGTTVTGLALGSCTLTANQAGNANFTAAPQVQAVIEILKAQSISGLSTLTLSAGGVAILNPTATSGLPVTLNSLTLATCTVGGGNVIITGVTTGQCILVATQSGNVQYAAAPYVAVTTTVTAANTSLVHNAQLTPWFTVSPATPTPQTGSTAQDATAMLEGIYSNTSGAYALIDSANHFDYIDYYGYLFGSLTLGSSTWNLDNSTVYYPSVVTPITATTANGSFVAKQSFTATTQGFTTVTPHLSLTYAVDNGYAASQTDVARSWLYNNGAQQFNLTVDNTGDINGTEADSAGGVCNITGSIVQTEPASQHNMYSMTLNASAISGTFCNLNTAHPYTGLAALHFIPAGANASNGSLPELVMLAQEASTSSPIQLVFYPQP